MLQSHLELIPTTGMPRSEWLNYQTKHIGGSSMGALLGLNPYMSELELFHFYVGDYGSLQKKQENLAMLMGHELEPVVANLWEHWGGDEPSLVQNLAAGEKVARCSVAPFIIKNPKWPHLHANIDRYIDASHEGREGILEIKTINGLAAEKYEDGLPASYVIQVQHYLAVCDEQYAELALLKDGRTLEVFAFERNQDLIDTMLRKAADFWHRVTEARALWADTRADEETRQQWIAALEPQPDDTPAYEQFLKKRWRTGGNPDIVLKGTEEMLDVLELYDCNGVIIKDAEKRQQACKNQLLHHLEAEGGDVMLFENGSKCTFRPDKHGKRTFRTTIKKNTAESLAV